MNELHTFLTTVWFALLGLIIALYVLLDGYDLGIGILSLLEYRTDLRAQMLQPLRGGWDANEVWLLLASAVLFGAFPLAYSLILHTLYVPIRLLAFGLITRAVGLQYSQRNDNLLGHWLFGFGSLLAVLAQGLMITGVWNNTLAAKWMTPFTLISSFGVVCAYALLGASYLLIRSRGVLPLIAHRWASAAFGGVALVMFTLLLWTSEWHHLPTLLGVLAGGALLRNLRNGVHGSIAPFAWSLAFILLIILEFSFSLYPDIIPGHLNLEQAAASSKTLVFMILGIGLLMPLMLAYNGFHYLRQTPDFAAPYKE